jgi:hypothetical protein
MYIGAGKKYMRKGIIRIFSAIYSFRCSQHEVAKARTDLEENVTGTKHMLTPATGY